MKVVTLTASLFALANASFYLESFWGKDAERILANYQLSSEESSSEKSLSEESSSEKSLSEESSSEESSPTLLKSVFLSTLRSQSTKVARTNTKPRASTTKRSDYKQLSSARNSQSSKSQHVRNLRSKSHRIGGRRQLGRLRFIRMKKSSGSAKRRRVETKRVKSSIPARDAEPKSTVPESPEATKPTTEKVNLANSIIDALPQAFRDAHKCSLKKLDPQEVIDRFGGDDRNSYMILMNDPSFYGPGGDMTVEKLATLTLVQRDSLVSNVLSASVEEISKTFGSTIALIIRSLLPELIKLGPSKMLAKWIGASGDNAVTSQSFLLWAFVYDTLEDKKSVNHLFAESFRLQLKKANPKAVGHDEFIKKVCHGEFENFDSMLGAYFVWMGANGLDRI
jgi:hypothetical protein